MRGIKQWALCVFQGAAMSLVLATPAIGQPVNPFQLLGNLLSTKPAELAKLLDQKKLAEADRYFGTEKQFFDENREAQATLIKRLASELNSFYDPLFSGAEDKLKTIPTLSVEAASVAVVEAQGLLGQYRALNTFSRAENRSLRFASLNATSEGVVAQLSADAPAAFMAFDHNAGGDFFDRYPVRLENPAFLNQDSEKLVPWVDTLSLVQIKALRERYAAKMAQGSALIGAMAKRFFSQTLASGPQPPSLASILGAVKAAKESGFPTASVPGARIAFVEVTSKTLLKEGQIEFPAQVEIDLPFEAVKADVDDMLSLESRSTADYIVVLDIAAARSSRRILGKRDVESRFVSGSRTEPNPAYDVVRSRMHEAQAGLNNAQSTYAQVLPAPS